ncbi:MAG: flagellar hook-basal body complex protein FliE [Actinomycetota bacterium]|nr:flagellar hook-basal body complex protein FliE [Actinomycetota bacterium]
MAIKSINILSHVDSRIGIGRDRASSARENPAASFQEIFQGAMSRINTIQKEADQAMTRFAAGEIDIDEVMIQAEKANVALQLTIQIRNKMVEAYQEISRMQI